MAGETTIAEAARRHGVSAESINRWRNPFIDAGKAMDDGMPGKAGSRGSLMERRQRAEIQELKLRWPKRRCSYGSGRKARSTSTTSLRTPRGPESGSRAAGREVRSPVRHAGTHLPPQSAKLRAGDDAVKGPWPTPAVDAAEALAAKYASDWPARGHRKIAAMVRVDGHDVNTSTVEGYAAAGGVLTV